MGQFIVSGSYDSTVRIWNADSGQPVGQSLEGHTESINSVAYSPDGQIYCFWVFRQDCQNLEGK